MTEFVGFGAGTSEAQVRQALAQMFTSTGSNRARPGVLSPGSGLQVTQTTSASGSVQVSAGMAVAQDTALAGATPLVLDTTKTVDVLGPNPVGGVPRNDLVVFDSATVSGGTGGVRVITGTPNAVPTDPTVPATATVLARLRHVASATAVPASAIDDLRAYTAMRGGVVRVASQADRDTLPGHFGLVVYRTDTKRLEVHNGTGWDVYAPNPASGVRTIGQVPANGFVQWTVTFPTGMFATAPRVTVTPSSGRLSMAARAVTATGCTVEAYNASTVASAASGEFFTWVATPA